MASNYISPISMDALSNLCQELGKNNYINAHDFERYQVKRGLRNSDGTGVMAGLTRICSVEGYYILDGERIPTDGKLSYRGYDIRDLVDNCIAEDRFGYEEVVWLLLFGNLPTANQLYSLHEVLSECRALPDEFVEDVIMKHASKDIMNKMARCILSLYSFDENPDDTSIPNVLRQSLQLIAQTPTIMNSAYQIKRRTFYNKTMFLHPINKEQTMAEYILNQLRVDKTFTREEAKLLDICLMLHADHGGGNNSTFSTRVLTSSGTDTYSAITAGFGSLKGPRHGGANIRVTHMMEDIIAHVADPTKPEQVKDYLVKILNKEAGDGSGLIYGMGHAVYTKSDPRAVILKSNTRKLAYEAGFEKEFKTLENVEMLTPEVFAEVKGDDKVMCANVDLYSGLVYKVLKIPEDLFTPLFATARIAGWCAHRLEELISGGRIMRPALRFVQLLLFTDSSTGRVTAAGAPLTYGLYALLLCAGVCCTVCALHQSHTAVAVAANGGSRRLTAVSYLVSVAFFFDFIYRCFLCYDLTDGAVYLQWNDLVSEGMTALFALLSCSYYFVVGRSYGGGRYDFRAFRFFHFVPALWGLCRLLTILAKMVSVLVDTQTVCEVLFLVALLLFLFSFATAVVTSRHAGRAVVFFGLLVFVCGCVLALPGLSVWFTGHRNLLNGSMYFGPADLLLGVFALAFVQDLRRRSAAD